MEMQNEEVKEETFNQYAKMLRETIEKLQKEKEVLERALELSCNELNDVITVDKPPQCFIKLAAKETALKMWQPKDNEHYWYIETNGTVSEACVAVEWYIANGNYYKTQKEAIEQAEYNKVMNRFRKYIETYSDPLDWNNTNQYKYCVVFDYNTSHIRYFTSIREKEAFGIHASSRQVLKDAVIYSAGSEKEFARIVFGGKNVS